MDSYSARLTANPTWAVKEARKIFRGESEVDRSLARITRRLDVLGIPYAVAGGLAVFHHGLRRFTEDVDLLIRGQDLNKIHESLVGRGYLPKFKGGKNLRDTESGVLIEFLIAGEYPGDGKPKPVAFPDPTDVVETESGIKYINLAALIELKLASWMTNSERPQDLADAQRLMRILHLPFEFGEKLNPYVRPQFEQLWRPRRFGLLIAADTGLEELTKLRTEGLTVEPWRGGQSLLAWTTDPTLAEQLGMHDEDDLT